MAAKKGTTSAGDCPSPRQIDGGDGAHGGEQASGGMAGRGAWRREGHIGFKSRGRGDRLKAGCAGERPAEKSNKSPRSGVSSSAPRLDRAGVKAPVAHKQDHAEGANDQSPCRGARRRKRILKDCERWFQAKQPQERHCSDVCRKEGERWRRWRASQGWRASERGKECRRCQSRRYRERQRQKREALQATCLQEKASARASASNKSWNHFVRPTWPRCVIRHHVTKSLCRSIVCAVAAKRCVGRGNVKHAGVACAELSCAAWSGAASKVFDRRILQRDAAVDLFLLAPNGEESGRVVGIPPFPFSECWVRGENVHAGGMADR